MRMRALSIVDICRFTPKTKVYKFHKLWPINDYGPKLRLRRRGRGADKAAQAQRQSQRYP